MEKSIPTQNAKLFVPDSYICMSTHMNPDHEIMNPQENNMYPRLEIMNPRIKNDIYCTLFILFGMGFICLHCGHIPKKKQNGERHESAAE